MAKKTLILSIDGGGIRGLIPATILALLQNDLKASLYDTFDMYAGSSVGSWLVLAISGLHYNGAQILSLFTESNIQKIFSKRFLSFLTLLHGSKYQAEGKRAVLNQIFQDKKFLSLEKQTLITAYDIINNAAVVFKAKGVGASSKYNPTLAEIADISSAAPTYFPPVKSTDSPPRWLVDGGIIANDPSLCIITEALRSGITLEEIKVLSIGSGRADKFSGNPEKYGEDSQNWGQIAWLQHGLINDLFSGNTTVTEYQATQLLNDRYFRINDILPVSENVMDNINPENILALSSVGHSWYQKNRLKLIYWLEN